ncbi:alpha/beta hydrolase [Pseudoxanthomonas sp. JBR18]|uniref:alpha/beta hydrolase n=1 Tax=Pseudoxanthomonas sp. JBR18 TaxID=2969308 RepID=UPI0023068E9E|nr:alpha/beta hydrolase [Pseudoxanthomonas sp. JBR18]WCE05562.1 alpha/beta hydrolase [Pseudoxanthomonas sp. JBR18]
MQADPFDPARLTPDVLAVLTGMAASGAPTLESLPIAEMRQAYLQVGALLGGEPMPVGQILELQAAGPAGPIPLRLYLPRTGTAPYATTVYLHGGGWSLGDLDSHDKVCRRLVHTAGCAVVAVDYRRAPEHPAPAGPDDVVAAVRWIAAQATELGLDASRLAVAGDSAGGSLAAVACQQLLGSEVALSAQVLFYPATDLSPTGDAFDSRRRNGAVPPLTLEAMQAMSGPFLCNGFDTRDPRVSPRFAADLRGLPPALIITAQCDALLDDGRLYRDALNEAGVPVEYIEYPGMIHGFIEMAGVLPAARTAMEQAAAFLGVHLDLAAIRA